MFAAVEGPRRETSEGRAKEPDQARHEAVRELPLSSRKGERAGRMAGATGLLLQKLRLQRLRLPRRPWQRGLSREGGKRGDGSASSAPIAKLSSSKARASRQAHGDAEIGRPPPKANLAFLFVGVIVFTVALMVASFPVGLYTVFGTRLSDNYSASTPVFALTYDLSFARVQVPVSSNLGDVFAVFLLVYF